MLLSLFEEGAECLGDVGQSKLVRLGKALAVALELACLESKIGLEGEAAVSFFIDGWHGRRRLSPRKDTCSARIWACVSSCPRCSFSSSTMLRYSAPVMVAMWFVYCTIDWNSVPRSSLRRATNFFTSMSGSDVMPLAIPIDDAFTPHFHPCAS